MPERPSPSDGPPNGSPDVPAPAPAPVERRRPQMADIARLAGVSISTVSRALAGSELVNAETRERVRALASSLNYTVNLGAQNLRKQRNRTIAVVIPYDRISRQHISDPFFLSMVGALADALTDSGFDMLLSRVDSESLDEVAKLVDSGVAIGIVLIGQWRHHDQLNALAARDVPIVVWGAQLPQQMYCTVGGDNELGGLIATRHLLGLGHRRIAFLGDVQLPEVELRHAGYLRALEEAGVEPDPQWLIESPFDMEAARTAVSAALRRLRPRFDALVAASDLLAIAATQAVREARLAVPADLSVIGYDDIAMAAYADPPLTTVHQPVRQAGVELVDALLALIDGQRTVSRLVPVHLVERRSCRAVADGAAEAPA
jgi:DNA-binding LacI/PurR family transcriptional regulator